MTCLLTRFFFLLTRSVKESSIFGVYLTLELGFEHIDL